MGRIFDVPELSELLGYSTDTVRTHLQRGTLPGVKVGKEWRCSESALMEALTPAAEASRVVVRWPSAEEIAERTGLDLATAGKLAAALARGAGEEGVRG